MDMKEKQIQNGTICLQLLTSFNELALRSCFRTTNPDTFGRTTTSTYVVEPWVICDGRVAVATAKDSRDQLWPQLEAAEMKMFRFSWGVRRMDRVKKEHVSVAARVKHVRDRVRKMTEMVGRCWWSCQAGEKGEDAEGWIRWKKMLWRGDPWKKKKGRSIRTWIPAIRQNSCKQYVLCFCSLLSHARLQTGVSAAMLRSLHCSSAACRSGSVGLQEWQ